MITRSEEVAELEVKLAEAKILKAEEDTIIREANLDPILCEMATILHNTMCSSNHADQCGWFYDKWSDVNTATSTFHNRACTKTLYYNMASELSQMFIYFYAEFDYSIKHPLGNTARDRAKIILEYVKKMQDIMKKR